MHIDPDSNFPTIEKGTAWQYCKLAVATLPWNNSPPKTIQHGGDGSGFPEMPLEGPPGPGSVSPAEDDPEEVGQIRFGAFGMYIDKDEQKFEHETVLYAFSDGTIRWKK